MKNIEEKVFLCNVCGVFKGEVSKLFKHLIKVHNIGKKLTDEGLCICNVCKFRGDEEKLLQQWVNQYNLAILT